MRTNASGCCGAVHVTRVAQTRKVQRLVVAFPLYAWKQKESARGRP